MQGQLLAGRYRLGEAIGRGGMGRVWRAHDELLHRAVAVKELTAAQYASESERTVLLARTQTEARAAARINHPAVVTVHDVLEHDDRPWIVMELVEGGSLADVVKESGALEPHYAARVGVWVLRALRAAHAAGVLHRDVKPGNVLLAKDGRVLLTDFGIAQVEGDTTLTRTGEVVGSVDYLAPERVRGADPGPSSDLWALGATLYTAVDGTSPYRRTTPLATMQAVVEENLPEPAGAGPLGPVITALLHKDPGMRPSAEEAETMLMEAAEGRRPAAVQEYLRTTVHPYEDSTRMPNAAPGQHLGEASGGAGYGPHRAQGAFGPAAAAGNGYGYPGSGAEPEPLTSYQPGPPTPAPHGSLTPPGAHTPPGSLTPPGPLISDGQQTASTAGPRRRGRRGWMVLGSVLAAVALVGGGTALGLQFADAGGKEPASRTPVPAGAPSGPAVTKSPQQVGGIPPDWRRFVDVEGFSLMLPPTWHREANGSQIDYTPDHGNHFVRISVDRSPDWENPYMHQLDLEKQLQDKLSDYHRAELTENTFRDRPGGFWEFSWTAVPSDSFPGPRHAIEQTYLDRDGTEYAIYMSSPDADWDTTRQQFDSVLRGWQPAPNGSVAGSGGSSGAGQGGGDGGEGSDDGDDSGE